MEGCNAEINKKIREESRKRIITYLGTCQGVYKPENLDTLGERISNYMAEKEWLQEEIKRKQELEECRRREEQLRRDEEECQHGQRVLRGRLIRPT